MVIYPIKDDTGSPEQSIQTYQSISRHIPEDSNRLSAHHPHVNVHTTALKLIKSYRELCTSATDSMFKLLKNCGEQSCDCSNRNSSSFMYLLYRISYSLIRGVELSNSRIIELVSYRVQAHPTESQLRFSI
jgi:hypothetical protein